MRAVFFGPDASTAPNLKQLAADLGGQFRHVNLDVRDDAGIAGLFATYGRDIAVVAHTAAQPSHDWAAREPLTDFGVNAVGTLNMLEATRRHCPEAPFIFCSTNKVYGDTPNRLPLEEFESRYEVAAEHTYFGGIREDMSIDHTLHSIFGVSKTAADLMVQEYGRYFDMPTVCFRGGTLTGPAHAATELHGFLGYVMRCTMTATPYTVYGYKGKQVRDAIHCDDVAAAFEAFFRAPRVAEVYNLGGGRHANCSVREAIALSEEIAGRELTWTYDDSNRVGDHIWWIGDNGRFAEHYPSWSLSYDIPAILRGIHDANTTRWTPS
jgi:CDP-paratose 2-epimerase